MNYEEPVKKNLVGIIMIIAFALGLTMIIAVFKGDSVDQPSSNKPIVKTLAEKTKVVEDQLPEKFPADLPLEENALVTQNYNVTTQDGRFQATRTFETQRTLAENLDIYRQYLKDSGWVVDSNIDEFDYKKISGNKGAQFLQISITENTKSKVKTVSISLTELP